MKAFTLISSLFAAAYAAEASEAAEAAQWAAYEALAEGKQGEMILPRFSQHSPLDGAKRVKSKVGPVTIVSTKMFKQNKMLSVPQCSGCLVTAMEATIRYPDGKEANVDTGAWLHHIAMFGALGGKGAGKGGLGGGLLSGGGGGGIWAAGNERPTLRLNSATQKYGLAMSSYMLIIDLMSEDSKPKNVTLEITYETVPSGGRYKPAQMYWLTIGEPAAKQGKYSFTSMPMTAKSGGKLLYAIGHMHDGGTHMTLKVGAQEKCKSVMFYNAREGYGKSEGAAAAAPKAGKSSKGAKMEGGHSHRMKRSPDGGHGGHSSGGQHISDPGACSFFGDITAGARMTAVAYYDATKYPLMMHNGKPEKLMGNMRVYVGPTI